MQIQPFSRRKFLAGTLATVACAHDWIRPPAAFAKHVKAGAAAAGPHPLSRQDWPPAIVPDHIGIVDKGYCCFTDEFGRLAIVDLRKPIDGVTPHLVSELSGLGKKVVAFQMLPQRGYGVVIKGAENTEPQAVLICIGFVPATDPHLMGETVLDRYQEVTALAAWQDLVCVGGASSSGENLVTVLRTGRGRQADFATLSTLTTSAPIVDMNLQDRNLLILQPGQADYVNLSDPSTPQLRKSLALQGDFKTLARFKDLAIVAGTAANASGDNAAPGACVVKSIALEPEPRIVSNLDLKPITSVLDASASRDRFLVLGEGSSDRYVASIGFDKFKQIYNQETITLPKEKGAGYGAHSTILLNNRTAYVASGWSGVQILNFSGTWKPTFKYTIPRLPASSVAAWGNNVVLAGSDLKLYDIAEPDKPSLVSTADMMSNVKSVVGAGSYVLCLSRDGVALRKMEKLNDTVATCKVMGTQLCYDTRQQKAYVLKDNGKKTAISKLDVYSNGVKEDKSYEVSGSFTRASAHNGQMAVSGLNDITLYGLGSESADEIGTRHFENLAIRDVALRDDCIVASAVDQTSKGFLLVLSKDQKDLKMLGSTDLPHDAVALASAGSRVVVVGKKPDGKDVATIIDISAPAAPKLVAVMPAVEAAAAVTIRDKLAIIAGRGIEIVSLS